MEVEKISPTVDDLLLIVSQSFLSLPSFDPPLDEDEAAVTFCDKEVEILLLSLIIADFVDWLIVVVINKF